MPMTEERSSQSPRAADGMTRELLALVADVQRRDAPRIAPRVEALVRLGATRRDIQEALAAAVAKGGRRSLRHAIDALAAFDDMARREATLETA